VVGFGRPCWLIMAVSHWRPGSGCISRHASLYAMVPIPKTLVRSCIWLGPWHCSFEVGQQTCVCLKRLRNITSAMYENVPCTICAGLNGLRANAPSSSSAKPKSASLTSGYWFRPGASSKMFPGLKLRINVRGGLHYQTSNYLLSMDYGRVVIPHCFASAR